MRDVLYVGDAACPSGFWRSAEGILRTVAERFRVTALGINYYGDPHDYPYQIFAAVAGGDAFGMGRIVWMCDYIKAEYGAPPAVILLQNDPWNIPPYLQQLKANGYGDIPVVGIIAVDGQNCLGTWLNELTLGIFWTQFALDEARAGGFTKPGIVIPLGVDRAIFRPMEMPEARQARGIPPSLNSAFVVGCVSRNQPRKRLDLLLRYFAHWVGTYDVHDARLLLHVAPTGDTGVQIVPLAMYYGIADRLMIFEPPVRYGVTDEELRQTYNCCDVMASTTQGEGFGLPIIESMACGIPNIVPTWAALGDWAKDAAVQVPCTSTAIGPPYVNVIGGVVDRVGFIEALQRLYTNERVYQDYRARGLALAADRRYDWAEIGGQVAGALDGVVEGNREVHAEGRLDDGRQDAEHRQEIAR